MIVVKDSTLYQAAIDNIRIRYSHRRLASSIYEETCEREPFVNRLASRAYTSCTREDPFAYNSRVDQGSLRVNSSLKALSFALITCNYFDKQQYIGFLSLILEKSVINLRIVDRFYSFYTNKLIIE